MHIAVCVTQVPDTTHLSVDTQHRLQSTGTERVMNAFCEYALETALRLKEARPDEVTVTAFSLSATANKEAIKRAIAMGCDAGYLIEDSSADALDAYTTAWILSKAIQHRHEQLQSHARHGIRSAPQVVPSATGRSRSAVEADGEARRHATSCDHNGCREGPCQAAGCEEGIGAPAYRVSVPTPRHLHAARSTRRSGRVHRDRGARACARASSRPVLDQATMTPAPAMSLRSAAPKFCAQPSTC